MPGDGHRFQRYDPCRPMKATTDAQVYYKSSPDGGATWERLKA
jgi:hypothetical protein